MCLAHSLPIWYTNVKIFQFYYIWISVYSIRTPISAIMMNIFRSSSLQIYNQYFIFWSSPYKFSCIVFYKVYLSNSLKRIIWVLFHILNFIIFVSINLIYLKYFFFHPICFFFKILNVIFTSYRIFNKMLFYFFCILIQFLI